MHLDVFRRQPGVVAARLIIEEHARFEGQSGQGREIEFNYNGKKYSITYGSVDGKEVTSFCEFSKETTEVEDVEGLVKVERDGITVLNMLKSLQDKDIYVF